MDQPYRIQNTNQFNLHTWLNYSNTIRRKPMSDGGKGSTPRPVDQKKYNDNWDLIFGKKKQEPNDKPKE